MEHQNSKERTCQKNVIIMNPKHFTIKKFFIGLSIIIFCLCIENPLQAKSGILSFPPSSYTVFLSEGHCFLQPLQEECNSNSSLIELTDSDPLILGSAYFGVGSYLIPHKDWVDQLLSRTYPQLKGILEELDWMYDGVF